MPITMTSDVNDLNVLAQTERTIAMKTLRLVASALIVIGALNWGLVALAGFDLVAWIAGLSFGQTNAFSRLVYGLVGLAGIYLAVALLAPTGPAHHKPAAA